MEESPPTTHVGLLCSPGMGHLIPVLELSKRLISTHSFKVTIFLASSSSSPPQAQEDPNKTSPQIINLPPVDLSFLLPPNSSTGKKLIILMRESLPLLRSALLSIQEDRPTTLIVDIFGIEALRLAEELNMNKHVYMTTSAYFLVLMACLPLLDHQVQGEYVDQKSPLPLPGCTPLHPDHVADMMLDRSADGYFDFLQIAKYLSKADGFLVNSWEELEKTTLGAIRVDEALRRVVTSPVYSIGPVIRSVGEEKGRQRGEVLKWLDEQPVESVIYVSFGSGGTLTREQTEELAWGLEISGVRFIWVAREPVEIGGDGAFFNQGGEGEGGFLPEGYLERNEGVGVVMWRWAPQEEILRHGSVGGFLTHCGWNSTLESICSGVPMVAWPLYSEQKMNAALMVEELGVAVRPGVLPTKGVVGREEIGRLARGVVEGEEGVRCRERVRELQRSGGFAVEKEGSSSLSLALFALACCSSSSSSSSCSSSEDDYE